MEAGVHLPVAAALKRASNVSGDSVAEVRLPELAQRAPGGHVRGSALGLRVEPAETSTASMRRLTETPLGLDLKTGYGETRRGTITVELLDLYREKLLEEPGRRT